MAFVKDAALEAHTPIIPPAPRLQVDLSVGSPDLAWWRNSMETREDRIQWWRDARFGCFIHWNASSVLAGEWKGQVYMGYAEHIQRMAKITHQDYIDAAIAVFNPTEFDADKWVRTIQATGMKYLVITAKHHDGFAMWDSEVSDYNIVDATPFGRDPIAELKEACDRHGLHFGLYYSHAFDWGEPNGPGNDWEWENPGGKKGLYGGLHWFDEHPELVPKYRQYLDKKSIPQVVELIKKYDPDLMWFDTASKLPLEETLRVLKAAREAKPDLLINSRVTYQGTVDFRDTNFGDYLNMGDRAVEFRPIDGDWETIPTTNESYGYHKHDHSHKTPDYLIQVLAKAVAKGGNVLLNIGPRSDGRIDPADLKILAGIGEWMQTNEPSIREAGRTTLTVQPWGQSTLDGNRFYLHVFDWPGDRTIEVGGLKSKITQAWMLADPTHAPLEHSRLDSKTVSLMLSGTPPKIGHAVVVMEVEDAQAVDAHRLLSTKKQNLLLGFDSIVSGAPLKYGDGKARRDFIYGWTDETQKLSWAIYLREPASFNLSVQYQRLGKPQPFTIKCGNFESTVTTRGEVDDSWYATYIDQEVGTLDLPAGMHLIELSPQGIPEADLMRFRGLILTPQKR